MSKIPPRVLAAFIAVAGLRGDTDKAKLDQHVELMRGLTAEYATVKVMLPRSRKALVVESNGQWDKKQWGDALRKDGPAAREGDLVQVTKVSIDDDKILLQINDGMKKKGSWKDKIQVSVGGVSTAPKDTKPNEQQNGTTIELHFKDSIGDVSSAQVKKMLATVLDFEKHSAAEQYIDSLPPEIQTAIKEKKPVEGMDRDQILMAMGRPVRKTRETKGDVEEESWQYGQPPGQVTFVVFAGDKVIKVQETYANPGGTVIVPPPPPR